MSDILCQHAMRFMKRLNGLGEELDDVIIGLLVSYHRLDAVDLRIKGGGRTCSSQVHAEPISHLSH
jgi:hypothetical protein